MINYPLLRPLQRPCLQWHAFSISAGYSPFFSNSDLQVQHWVVAAMVKI